MKSLIPAALALVLEAGFVCALAALPSTPDRIDATVQVVRASAPSEAPATATHAVQRPSRRS
jgi:hypothetical protein